MIVEIIAALFIIAVSILMIAVMVFTLFSCCGGAAAIAMADVKPEDYAMYGYSYEEEYERFDNKSSDSIGDTPRDN